MQQNRKRFSKETVRRLLGYATGTFKLRFVFVLILILISAAASVASSIFLQVLIDDYITPLLGIENPIFTELLKAIMVMGVIYLVGVVATYLYNRQMAIIGQGVLKRLRDEMFDHMQKLPIKYFDTHSYGDVMSHYTNDIDALRMMISQGIPVLFSSIVTMVLILLAMIASNLFLTILVLLLVVLMLRVSKYIAGKSGVHFVAQQRNLGMMNGYIEEMIMGQKVVKVFNYEQESEQKFDVKNEELFFSSDNANKYANIMMPTMVSLAFMVYVIIAVVGGYMAIHGFAGMTLGAVIAYTQLTKSFSMPIGQISQQVNSVIMALAGAERIFKMMDEEPEQDTGYVTLVNAEYNVKGELAEAKQRTGIWAWKHPHKDGTLTYKEVKGDIVLDNVDFSYNGEKMILNDISFYAKPGQKIALVGATGAGKTTITNLLNRFYDIADGKIRYDGININKIIKSDLRRSLGVVLQDTNLFTGTVAENIRYGKLDATEQEIVAAAKLAGADGFICRLPDGYDTMLMGNGDGLSQGQRQLSSARWI